MNNCGMPITWCGHCSCGSDVASVCSLRMSHSPRKIRGIVVVVVVIIVVGTATHVSIPPMSRNLMNATDKETSPNGNNLSPTARGEMILIEIINAILTIIASKDVE